MEYNREERGIQNMEHKIQNLEREYNAQGFVPNSKFRIPCSVQKGAFLLEILIVIALLGVILGVGTQAVFVSLQSGKISGERDAAVGLASEALEAVRGITEENWQNIYLLTKGSTQYHPVQSGTKWATSTASETITLNNATYTRYFVVQNVCRDATAGSRLITGITDTTGGATTCTGSTGDFDPSTQKVTVTVSWTNADPVIMSEYFFRWKNKTCTQTAWTSAVPGNTVASCGSGTYDSIDSTATTTGGIHLI
jgi:type II secretory pathway pseudopilin PulG